MKNIVLISVLCFIIGCGSDDINKIMDAEKQGIVTLKSSKDNQNQFNDNIIKQFKIICNVQEIQNSKIKKLDDIKMNKPNWFKIILIIFSLISAYFIWKNKSIILNLISGGYSSVLTIIKKLIIKG